MTEGGGLFTSRGNDDADPQTGAIGTYYDR